MIELKNSVKIIFLSLTWITRFDVKLFKDTLKAGLSFVLSNSLYWELIQTRVLEKPSIILLKVD